MLKATLSAPRQRGDEFPIKVRVRLVEIRGEPRYQFESHLAHKTLHANLTAEEAQSHLLHLLEAEFRQAILQTVNEEHQVQINRRGEARITSRKVNNTTLPLSHNRVKPHLLPEGQPCDFLIRLGVMTAEGKVIAAKYDKFRQINRFLEMIADVREHLPSDRPLRIVDFGCGKSYLTFALYYYLTTILRREAQIIGIDRKMDVIAHCNAIARDLNYTGLAFQVGDIAAFEVSETVDLMVSLHACDTATDDALAKAISWQTQIILAVPCCQHELFGQIRSEPMRPLLKHGILKERFAALLTDAIRAELLEKAGYSVQVLEFIDMEHTPKNLLLRAVRPPHASQTRFDAEMYAAFRDFWQARPTLERLLNHAEQEPRS